MDPFWAITLSTIVIAKFWKRERIKSKERKYQKEQLAKKVEQEKQNAVTEKYTAIFSQPMSKEEEEAEKLQRDIEKQKERDIEQLRKQGYTDELISVILPTINNGQ